MQRIAPVGLFRGKFWRRLKKEASKFKRSKLT
jgi:hypothetical protein